MAQQILVLGSAPGSGDGEPLFSLHAKVQANFTDLYAQISALQGKVSEGLGVQDVANALVTVNGITQTVAESFAVSIRLMKTPFTDAATFLATVPQNSSPVLATIGGRRSLYANDGGRLYDFLAPQVVS